MIGDGSLDVALPTRAAIKRVRAELGGDDNTAIQWLRARRLDGTVPHLDLRELAAKIGESESRVLEWCGFKTGGFVVLQSALQAALDRESLALSTAAKLDAELATFTPIQRAIGHAILKFAEDRRRSSVGKIEWAPVGAFFEAGEGASTERDEKMNVVFKLAGQSFRSADCATIRAAVDRVLAS